MTSDAKLLEILHAVEFAGPEKRCPVCHGTGRTGHGQMCDVGRAIIDIQRRSREQEAVRRIDWESFRSAGLLFFANSILHAFGWAIVFEYADEKDSLTGVYPAMVKYRGFDDRSQTTGFMALSMHMAANADAFRTIAGELAAELIEPFADHVDRDDCTCPVCDVKQKAAAVKTPPAS